MLSKRILLWERELRLKQKIDNHEHQNNKQSIKNISTLQQTIYFYWKKWKLIRCMRSWSLIPYFPLTMWSTCKSCWKDNKNFIAKISQIWNFSTCIDNRKTKPNKNPVSPILPSGNGSTHQRSWWLLDHTTQTRSSLDDSNTWIKFSFNKLWLLWFLDGSWITIFRTTCYW